MRIEQLEENLRGAWDKYEENIIAEKADQITTGRKPLPELPSILIQYGARESECPCFDCWRSID